MTELISAAIANKLSRPTFQEGLARYKDTIAEAITEAAMGQVRTISLRVPAIYGTAINEWLELGGYDISIQEDELEDWDFFTVSWGRAK